MNYVACLASFLLYTAIPQFIYSFTIFVPQNIYWGLLYVRHSGSECLNMSNTSCLWSVFLNLGWGIKQSKACYEILCVGKTGRPWRRVRPLRVSWGEELPGVKSRGSLLYVTPFGNLLWTSSLENMWWLCLQTHTYFLHTGFRKSQPWNVLKAGPWTPASELQDYRSLGNWDVGGRDII